MRGSSQEQSPPTWGRQEGDTAPGIHSEWAEFVLLGLGLLFVFVPACGTKIALVEE